MDSSWCRDGARTLSPTEPYVYLLLGAAFTLLHVGRWVLQPAAWLAPIFLLRFVHAAPDATAVAWLWVAIYVALAVAQRGVIPVPGAGYWGVIAILATIFTLPYLAERLLVPRWAGDGYASTLVFPVALTVVHWLNGRFGPYATWGSPAYTQYGDLPLVQVARAAGIDGITFLVGWAASVAAWAWSHGFAWDVIGRGVMATSAILVAILLLGAARLQWSRSRGADGRGGAPGGASGVATRALRVAGLVHPERIVPGAQVMAVLQGRIPDSERESLRARMREAQEWFLEATAREARAGAQLVVWPEADCLVFKEDEPAFFERVRAAAAASRIHLVAAMAVVEPGAARPFDNRASLIGADGNIHFTYRKTHPVPGWEASCIVRGDGRLGIADTALGRIAVAICYDADFPQLIRQAGRARADLLVVPANDWPAIKHLHWRMATFRAAENGIPLVRVTKSGVSGAVDACGRVLALVDETAAPPPPLVAQIALR